MREIDFDAVVANIRRQAEGDLERRIVRATKIHEEFRKAEAAGLDVSRYMPGQNWALRIETTVENLHKARKAFGKLALSFKDVESASEGTVRVWLRVIDNDDVTISYVKLLEDNPEKPSKCQIVMQTRTEPILVCKR